MVAAIVYSQEKSPKAFVIIFSLKTSNGKNKSHKFYTALPVLSATLMSQYLSGSNSDDYKEYVVDYARQTTDALSLHSSIPYTRFPTTYHFLLFCKIVANKTQSLSMLFSIFQIISLICN